ncbi:MAG: cyclic nucleotide-binding domain-containing protein [Spirochaetales bacterium]|nr:cyclic nucleotide-binding domain-containing protein [Spirochaetales bacterium]
MIEKYFVATGIQWVEIKEADLRILCGAPMDSIKHLKARGFLKTSEIEGHYYEYGPNVILLSDLATQNGSFCNLSEFPVLHMIYKQGMGIPGHPNSRDGKRPLIMGTMEQVLGQQNYIFRGNTGLCTLEELREADFEGEELEAHWHLKHHFHSGRVTSTNELIDGLVIENEEREIRNGVTIKREDINRYIISYKGESVSVDLNLKEDEEYGTTFDLGYHKINREYFSVVHCGEGNGWDETRSCMGSIITFQDKIYLIDAGPHIDKILTSLGICNSQIDGIFQTHAHDDHFAGLTSLFQTGHKINYYATKAVRHTVQKKFAALTDTDEEAFGTFFKIHDLTMDSWNDINGLDVKPLYSPHPLETTIFYFRAFGEYGEAVYGHLADIIGYDVLEKVVSSEPGMGISREFFNKIWDGYTRECDLKKVDCGKGFVHGNAADFRKDPSRKILISHTDWKLTPKEKEIGNNAVFGQQDILIPARVDYTELYGRMLLNHYFPQTPFQDRELLMNSHRITFPPGTILIGNDEIPDCVYLVLSGFVEYINSERDLISTRSAGSLLGEMEVLRNSALEGTYRTSCYMTALKIPSSLFLHFINRSRLSDVLMLLQEKRHFILDHSKVANELSYMQLNHLVDAMDENTLPGNWTIPEDDDRLFIIRKGNLTLYFDDQPVDDLGKGGIFGLASVLTLMKNQDRISTEIRIAGDTPCLCYSISRENIKEIPVLQWQFWELYKNRLKKSRRGRV